MIVFFIKYSVVKFLTILITDKIATKTSYFVLP